MKKIKLIMFSILLLSFVNNSVFAGLVNVNTATAEEIAALKGIGPVKAAAIVVQCQTDTPCIKPSDLLKVKGVGNKTLEKIKSSIVFK